MLLSIVIVNWNTCQILRECLQSIYKSQVEFDFDVWIIDNHSIDGSQAMIKSEFPQVNLIENEVNYGFAKANNQAFNEVSGTYILMLNPDTIVDSFSIEKLVDFMEQTEDAGCAGSKLLNPDGTLQQSCYPFPTLLREAWRLMHLDKFYSIGTYEMATWSNVLPRSVDVVMGASLIIRNNLLRLLKGLDESYFIYSEEVDLCYRVKREGWNIYWVPESVVIHYGGQSTKQIAEEMFLELYRSKILFFKKNYGLFSAFLYKILLWILAFARVVVSPALKLRTADNNKKREIQKMASNYWGLVLRLASM